MEQNSKTKRPTEVEWFVAIEGLRTDIRRLNNNFAEVKKMFGSIQNSLDLIYNDRDILRDIKEDIEGARGLILAFDKHNENLTQDLKREVVDTGSKVEQSAEEVKDTVDYKTDEIKEHVEGVKQMRNKFVKGKSFFTRLFRRG